VILDFGGTLSDGALDWDPYHEKIRSILAGKGARDSPEPELVLKFI
jgi:hypothetical protein